KEFFGLSMQIAEKAVRAIRQQPADLIASDCPLAGLQLDQAGASAHAGGRTTLHPIQVVRDAYGLNEGERPEARGEGIHRVNGDEGWVMSQGQARGVGQRELMTVMSE
ncbi:MAG TPA: hypothetical protein VLE25_14760, partial [Nitrospira sp.]|nr:hypothetical protein [Nitrospira sp.]